MATNIITTIPKRKGLPDWPSIRRVLLLTDGEKHLGEEYPWFHLINTLHVPKGVEVGKSVCFIVYNWEIRGYMDIVDIAMSEDYRGKHRLGKQRRTKCIVLANFHESNRGPMRGFQGMRKTILQP